MNSSKLFRVEWKVTFRSPSFPGAMPLWDASGMATAAPRGSRVGWRDVEWWRKLFGLGMRGMREGIGDGGGIGEGERRIVRGRCVCGTSCITLC